MRYHILYTEFFSLNVWLFGENLIDPEEKPFIQDSKVMIDIGLKPRIIKIEGDYVLKLL